MATVTPERFTLQARNKTHRTWELLHEAVEALDAAIDQGHLHQRDITTLKNLQREIVLIASGLPHR